MSRFKKNNYTHTTPFDIPDNYLVGDGDKYKLIKKIGTGASSEVYLGINIAKPEEQVAVKLERFAIRYPLLWRESRLYQTLQEGTGTVGIPKLIWYGQDLDKDYNILILELLGPTLDHFFNICSQRFSLKTVLMLAIDVLRCVESLHSKSYIHRDIKPDNFAMGLGSKSDQVSKHLSLHALH